MNIILGSISIVLSVGAFILLGPDSIIGWSHIIIANVWFSRIEK